MEKSDERSGWLLRTRPTGPRNRHAAEQGDELAPLHSITSSARSRIDVGNVTPIARAVLRLTANSNWTACSTGKSAGLAPRRILAVSDPARRANGTKSTP